MTVPAAHVVEDIEACRALQEEEWEVLQSIYPDYLSGGSTNGTIKIEIPVELSEPRFVVPLEEGSHPTEGSIQVNGDRVHKIPSHSVELADDVSLSTFPPLLLELMLPPAYPSYCPPEIKSLHATHGWLGRRIVPLRQQLLAMWNAGEGVLYSWIECIRSGEFLDALHLLDSKDGKDVIIIPHPALSLIMPLLTEYENSMQQARFSQASYHCEICLTSIKGARCVSLSCFHVFCRPCLEDFWGLCITEGDVGRVGCPDTACVKESREATEEEVRRVVTEDDVRRWKWLRQKRLTDRDPSMIHCPMSFCQTPVPKPQNAEEGSGWDRLRTCPECGYSFCAYCRRTWHGPISECPLTSTESFVLEYMECPAGSPQRELIERRYGKANITRLVAKYEEDQANKKWLDQSTMTCPSCHIKVEKSVGCNHMTCARCGQHFCYRCGDKLMASNPYLHFSTPGHPCFSKLFDYQSVENEWQPVEGFEYL